MSKRRKRQVLYSTADPFQIRGGVKKKDNAQSHAVPLDKLAGHCCHVHGWPNVIAGCTDCEYANLAV